MRRQLPRNQKVGLISDFPTSRMVKNAPLLFKTVVFFLYQPEEMKTVGLRQSQNQRRNQAPPLPSPGRTGHPGVPIPQIIRRPHPHGLWTRLPNTSACHLHGLSASHGCLQGGWQAVPRVIPELLSACVSH